jgi:hypothetical protein
MLFVGFLLIALGVLVAVNLTEELPDLRALLGFGITSAGLALVRWLRSSWSPEAIAISVVGFALAVWALVLHA